MSNINERLLAERTAQGISQQKLADMAGVSLSSITFLESGRNKSSRFVVQIANALGVTAEWLQTGSEPKKLNVSACEDNNVNKNNALQNNDYSCNVVINVNFYKLCESRKEETEGMDELLIATDETISVPVSNQENIAEAQKNKKAFYVIGDAMEPTLQSGGVAIVDSTITEIVDGDIYIFIYNENIFFRRLRVMLSGDVVASSDNQKYPAENLKIKDISIIGKVSTYIMNF